MTSKETFARYQPRSSNDPVYTAIAPGGLSAKASAVTPLILDTSSHRLVTWGGIIDGATIGILVVTADQINTTLAFYRSGMFRYKDVFWPEAASGETKKRTAFARTAINVV